MKIEDIQFSEITEICGLPGIGKTLFAINLCMDNLLNEDQSLNLTNVPIFNESIFIDCESTFDLTVAKNFLMNNYKFVKYSEMHQKLYKNGNTSPIFSKSNYKNTYNQIECCDKLISERFHLFNCNNMLEFIALCNILRDDYLGKHPQINLIVIDSLAFLFKHLEALQDFSPKHKLINVIIDHLTAFTIPSAIDCRLTDRHDHRTKTEYEEFIYQDSQIFDKTTSPVKISPSSNNNDDCIKIYNGRTAEEVLLIRNGTENCSPLPCKSQKIKVFFTNHLSFKYGGTENYNNDSLVTCSNNKQAQEISSPVIGSRQYIDNILNHYKPFMDKVLLDSLVDHCRIFMFWSDGKRCLLQHVLKKRSGAASNVVDSSVSNKNVMRGKSQLDNHRFQNNDDKFLFNYNYYYDITDAGIVFL